MHTVTYTSREPQRAASAECERTSLSAQETTDRLRGWAAMMNAKPHGEPFLRLEDTWSTNIQVADDAKDDQAAGVVMVDTPHQHLLVVDDVEFVALDSVLRAIDEELLQGVDYQRLGPPEFHGREGGFVLGSVVVPMTAKREQLPETLDVRDEETVIALPAAGLQEPEPEGMTEAPRAAPEAETVRAIAVTSQIGSMGDTIAFLAANRLGWHFCHDQIVDEAAAADPDIGPGDVERATHHRSLMDRILESMATASITPVESPAAMAAGAPLLTMVPDETVRDAVAEAMARLVEEGRVVMTGHGAALAMRGHPATLSILVTAPADVRVQRLATSGMGDAEAADMVHAADDERRKFFHQAYGVEWTDASNYDLCINSARLNGAAAAEAIARIVLNS